MMITMSIRLRFAGLGEAGVGTDVNLCSELVSVLAMMLLLKQLNSEQFLMPRSNQGCGLLTRGVNVLAACYACTETLTHRSQNKQY